MSAEMEGFAKDPIDNVDAKDSLGTNPKPFESSAFYSSRIEHVFVHPQEYRGHYPGLRNLSVPYIIPLIKSSLSSQALAVFASTAVGHFLDMPATNNSGTIVHYLLSREIKREDDGDPFCMNFGIGGHTMRFGMNEFALATGLSFKLASHKMEYETNPLPKSYVDSLVMQTHFPGKDRVCVRDALERLKTGNIKTFTDDENVRLALLVFVHVLLLGKQHHTQLDPLYCHLVDNLDAFNKYPWGHFTHRITIRQFRTTLKKKKSGPGPLFPSYSVFGFAYALQAWALASIPGILDLCGRVVVENNSGPWRAIILRVSCTKCPTYKDMISLGEDLIVDCDRYKLYDVDMLRRLGLVKDKAVGLIKSKAVLTEDESESRLAEESKVGKETGRKHESSCSKIILEGIRECSNRHASDSGITNTQLSDLVFPYTQEGLDAVEKAIPLLEILRDKAKAMLDSNSHEGASDLNRAASPLIGRVICPDPSLSNAKSDSVLNLVNQVNTTAEGGLGVENNTGKNSTVVPVYSPPPGHRDATTIDKEEKASDGKKMWEKKRPCAAESAGKSTKRKTEQQRQRKHGNEIISPFTTIMFKKKLRNDYAGESLDDPGIHNRVKRRLNIYIWNSYEKVLGEEIPEAPRELNQLKWTDYVRLLGGNEGPHAGWLSELIVDKVSHSMRINTKLTENTKWTTVSSYFARRARDKSNHGRSKEASFIHHTRKYKEGNYEPGGKPWSTVDVVYAPVLLNAHHWVAIAIWTKTKQVLIYDSLYDYENRKRSTKNCGIPSEVGEICKALRLACCNGEWLADYANHTQHVPKSGPGSSGVYALCFILCLIKGVNLDRLEHEDYIKECRRRFAVELYLNGEHEK